VFEDAEACYRAVHSRDARFDGWFFTAVVTTGIYCRPSCPATTPKRANVRFFPTAAAAQRAGFRACKRCRPDAAPGSPEWDARADVVARAMRLIADGAVDREGVGGLASRLGYSVRQLERLMRAEVGATPLALARAQRAQQARVLIELTDLPFGTVTFASGFTSIRQFNDTVRSVFATTPSDLRARAQRRDHCRPVAVESIVLRLPFRSPFHPVGVFGHLVATAVPGVESWEDGAFVRSVRLPHGPATVRLTPAEGHVRCAARLGDLRDLAALVARCRRLLDLDADPVAVDAELAADPRLAPLVAAGPGRRVPRTVDGAELAIRAVLGQQVSTRGARAMAARMVLVAGTPLPAADGRVTHLFPEPAALLEAHRHWPGMPLQRRGALCALLEALAAGRLRLDPGADWTEARCELAALGGIGPWTIATIAMRALGDPDAFPATDLGVKAAATRLGLAPGIPLERHAERWRPWRAYATQYLWGTADHPINRLEEVGR